MLTRHARTFLAGLTAAAAGLALLVPASAEAIAPQPAQEPSPADVPPPGSNDWTCKPDAAHPQPVVLVNGTFESMTKNWPVMSPYLADHGYCVFAFNYGNFATGPIEDSAQELQTFVDRVRAATGSARVDLVGHSQGGMMPRYYLKFLGGYKFVDDLVGLAPSNHGTEGVIAPQTGDYTPPGGETCAACDQQQAGSPFLQKLNAGGDTQPRVHYTVIATRYDEVVTPYQSQFLDGPTDRVTNILLQDKCAADSIEHDQMPNDPVAQRLVLDALRQDGPASKTVQPSCAPWGA